MIKIPLIDRFVRGRPTLERVIESVGWSFVDNLVRKVVGFLVGAWVARYLGPERFGLWSYVIALTALFEAIASLGVERVALRELVKLQDKRDEILGTTLFLCLLGSLLSFALMLIYSIFIAHMDSFTLKLIIIASLPLFFNPLTPVRLHYHSQILLKYIIWAYSIAFIVVTLTKIALILLKASLIHFVLAGSIEPILGVLILTWFYLKDVGSLRDWRFRLPLAKELLRGGLPLILSGLAVMVYMRIDQVMIKEMLDDRSLGLYSVAVKLSEVWYFVPGAIASAVFPAVVKSKELGVEVYHARLSKYFAFMAWIGLSIGSLFTLTGSYLVRLLFGVGYEGSVGALIILVWSGVGICFKVASDSWFLSERLERGILHRELLGAGINVLLNLLFIPRYGINGAALATLISYSFVGIFYDILSGKTRGMFFMKLRSIPYGVYLFREYGAKLLKGC